MGFSLIHLRVEDILRYWAQNNIYQRSIEVRSYNHDFPWDVDVRRLNSIGSAALRLIAVPPIKLHLSQGSVEGVCFADGRHRICYQALEAAEFIPSIVKTKDAASIMHFIGG